MVKIFLRLFCIGFCLICLLSCTKRGYDAPSVVTEGPVVLSQSSVLLSGTVSEQGTEPVLERGICFSQYPDPVFEDALYRETDAGVGTFSQTVTGLSRTQTYYTRAYAINMFGISYGESVGFRIADLQSTVSIRSEEGLIQFRDNLNFGHDYEGVTVRLENDIPLIAEWEPSYRAFRGTFDGQGHRIINLRITSLNDNQGFIHLNYGTIKNLEITNGSITAYQVAGGICAINYGEIRNCSFSGEVHSSYIAGGIVGSCYAYEQTPSIDSCVNYGTITSGAAAGGICGMTGSITEISGERFTSIQNCVNYGKIELVPRTIFLTRDGGGIVGEAHYSKIFECSNEGEVGGGPHCGGIVGTATLSYISSCVNAAPITGEGYLGGIAGSMNGTLAGEGIADCTNSGDVTSDEASGSNYGGIVGKIVDSRIESSENTAPVTGRSNNIGGVAGDATNSRLDRCLNRAAVGYNGSTANATGGIAGTANASDLTECINYGPVDGRHKTGGIVGTSKDNRLTGVENNGEVHGVTYVAGITGYQTGTSVTVFASRNLAPIGGESYVGGISGNTPTLGVIAGCYNSADISGGKEDLRLPTVGGLCGMNNGHITASYNCGDVTDNILSEAGGICGTNYRTVTGCFYLPDTEPVARESSGSVETANHPFTSPAGASRQEVDLLNEALFRFDGSSEYRFTFREGDFPALEKTH